MLSLIILEAALSPIFPLDELRVPISRGRYHLRLKMGDLKTAASPDLRRRMPFTVPSSHTVSLTFDSRKPKVQNVGRESSRLFCVPLNRDRELITRSDSVSFLLHAFICAACFFLYSVLSSTQLAFSYIASYFWHNHP